LNVDHYEDLLQIFYETDVKRQKIKAVLCLVSIFAKVLENLKKDAYGKNSSTYFGVDI
jgi:hypothetical protein